ncbi:MAG: MurR/RpiR family transcriptional regulator [Gammaproteobacteria bacterium]|nr:MurR/RpiR family transcriptional regulator [Gammaproteobacteria bacterium]
MSRRPSSRSSVADPAPLDPEALRARIIESYPRLSGQLQKIARFSLDYPRIMALETVATIAERAEVQPSAVVRFAQSIGFSGYSEMQRVYHTVLLEGVSSYTERLRRALSMSGEPPPSDAGQILGEFCGANTASLQHLRDSLAIENLLRAIEILGHARVVHLMGVRRSFPVAAYLVYALNHAGCKAHLLSGLAGLVGEETQLMEPADALIAISAHPYAPETLSVAESAARARVPIIALTDSLVSPLARLASLCLVVHEAELRGFRSLTANLCLAQSLVVALALRGTGERATDGPAEDP